MRNTIWKLWNAVISGEEGTIICCGPEGITPPMTYAAGILYISHVYKIPLPDVIKKTLLTVEGSQPGVQEQGEKGHEVGNNHRV